MEYCKFCNYKTHRSDNMTRHLMTKIHYDNIMKWKSTPEGAQTDIHSHKLDKKMDIIKNNIDEETIKNSKQDLRRKLAKVQRKNTYERRHVTCECGGAYADLLSKKEIHKQTRKHQDFVNQHYIMRCASASHCS